MGTYATFIASLLPSLSPYVPVEFTAPGGQVVPEHVAVADGPPVGDDLVRVKDPEVAVAPVGLAPGTGLAQVVATDGSTGKISKNEKVRVVREMLTRLKGLEECGTHQEIEGVSLPTSTGEQVEFARTDDRHWPIGQTKYSK